MIPSGDLCFVAEAEAEAEMEGWKEGRQHTRHISISTLGGGQGRARGGEGEERVFESVGFPANVRLTALSSGQT